MRIIISPFSRPLRNGKWNAKNYPYWSDVIEGLPEHSFIQLGVRGEGKFVDDFRIGLPLKEIEKLIAEADCWASVDNFLPHLIHACHIPTPGIVIFGYSDPDIFGYTENQNLLKSRGCLREKQFDFWENVPFDPSVFVNADMVIEAVKGCLK